jgi:D-3-phosphoglycerate dehydrogenase
LSPAKGEDGMGNERPAVRVLVADAIAEAGVARLTAVPGFTVDVRTGLSASDLAATLPDYDALIVRSATKVTAELLARPGRLRAIGRAGTGVDNIDLEAATRAGVVVMNTPGGNSTAAAEQTIALLTGLARNVPQAHMDLKAGHWNRKQYLGVELTGKTLGIVGLGRIGREVARRARGLRMVVLGYDPIVTADAAEGMGVAYRSLDDLVAESDFITLHLPLIPATRHVIDARRIAAMRPGTRLINCARGGLIDDDALLAALESGHIAGAALDVFEHEPPAADGIVAHPRVVVTPHLGASTVEAQERVGVEIAEKVRDYLVDGVILDAVNFPAIDRETYDVIAPILTLADRLGRFLAQAISGGIRSLEVATAGTFSDLPLRPLAMAAAKGLLTPSMQSGVSFVNALTACEQRGIAVEERRTRDHTPFTGLVRLTIRTEHETATVAGTLFNPDLAKIVEIDGVAIELRPEGHLLLIRNRDVPGVVGKIGTILGRANVNIAGIQLGRPEQDERAVSVIQVDGPVDADALREIESIDEILLARAIEV